MNVAVRSIGSRFGSSARLIFGVMAAALVFSALMFVGCSKDDDNDDDGGNPGGNTGSAYTVTFNPNGGTVSPTSAKTGDDGKLAELPEPTREGYTFDGWYTTATAGTKVTESRTYSANTTIYARWTAEPVTPSAYTITFDAQSGTVSPTSGTTGTDGKLAELPEPTREGYTFDGWYTMATGGTKVTESRTYSANTTIYARWTAEPVTPAAYTITFDPNGGTVSPTSVKTGDDGKLAELPKPTRNGYTFNGWYTTATAGTAVTESRVYTANTTIYAHWTEYNDNWYLSDSTAAVFHISTAAELAELADWVNRGKTFANKTIILDKDISLSGYNGSNKDFNGGKGWFPIGVSASSDKPFAGIFDGNGKKVSGLFIDDKERASVGLFGIVSGEIRDLGVEDVNISGKGTVGGLAGSVDGGTIENCYTSGVIRSTDVRLGGVVGRIVSGTVKGCNSTATLSGTNNVGGVVGSMAAGTLFDSFSTGEINGANQVGGVVGLLDNNSSVSTCYSTGAVYGAQYVGGVAGYIRGTASVTNCYSASAVTGGQEVGGVAGRIFDNGKVINCYSTGVIVGNSNVGGIVGYASGSGAASCAALNKSVTGNNLDSFSRVAGGGIGGLPNNVAFAGMILEEGDIIVPYRGTDITVAEILSDPTMGNRFRAIDGWTIESGKLPGLLGKAVDMPAHLK